MATVLKASGASMSAVGAKFALMPHADLCDGLWLMGGTIADSRHNLIYGKPDAVVVGSPTVGSNYIVTTGGGGAYLQTAIDQTADTWFVAVARALADTNTMIIGNYQSTSSIDPTGKSYGAALSLNSVTAGNSLVTARFGQGWVTGTTHNTSYVETTETIAVGADVLIDGWATSANFQKIVRNETAGVQGNNSPTTAQTTDLGAKFRIGSTYDTSYTGQARIYAVAAFHAAPATSDIRTDVLTWLRGYMSDVWSLTV